MPINQELMDPAKLKQLATTVSANLNLADMVPKLKVRCVIQAQQVVDCYKQENPHLIETDERYYPVINFLEGIIKKNEQAIGGSS